MVTQRSLLSHIPLAIPIVLTEASPATKQVEVRYSSSLSNRQNTCNSSGDTGKCGMMVSPHVKVNASIYSLLIWENDVYF